MPMHGQFYQELDAPHINKTLSLSWLSDSRLKRKTEADICTIQEQSITTKIHREISYIK